MADGYNALDTIITAGHILLVPIVFIPLIINLRYYKKIKIIDYLLLSIYFFIWIVTVGITFWAGGFELFSYSWTGTFGSNPEVVDWLIYNIIWLFVINIDSLPLVIVAIRAKYGEKLSNVPRSLMFLVGFVVFINFLTIFDQEQTKTSQDIFQTNLTYWATWLTRIIFHGIVGYIFYTTEYNQNPRTQRSRLLWVYSSIFWITSMFWFMVPTGFLGYRQDGTRPLVDLFSIGFAVLAELLIAINHILHPESVIITKEQVHIALKMYNKIDLSGSRLADIGISHVKKYLDSLPPEFRSSIGE